MTSAIVDSASPESRQKQVRVWDIVVRLFHWTTVTAVLTAFLTEEWRDLHKLAGYVVLGALVVRIIWGFIGTPHARFADFVPGPAELLAYLRSMFVQREPRHLGHNPAGGAMVITLLLALALTCATGWMLTLDAFWGDELVEEAHEVFSNGLLVLIPLHVIGVIWSSRRHRENLVKAMITGDKPVSTQL